MNEFLCYLDELFPEPKCELEYSKDYELLIAVVLSAQTTDKSVNAVTKILFKKYPSLYDLSKADINDIKNIIRPIGTFNKKSYFVKDIAEKLLNLYGGIVPNNHKDLESLPGVGHKTANVVLGNLYNIPAFAVDTHVSRVSKRLGFVEDCFSVLEIEKSLKNKIPINRWIRTHHQMVLFGRYYCKAKNPNCLNCKMRNCCKKGI